MGITKSLLFILGLILAVSPAMAAWTQIGSDIYLGPNNNDYIAGVNIRVLSIDADLEQAQVQISAGSNILFNGVMTKSTGYTDEGNLKVFAKDFRFYDSAHPEMSFDIQKWVAGTISRVNFPSQMYKADTYKVLAIIKNDGTQPTKYTVELSGNGGFSVKASDSDENPKHASKIKKTIPSAVQEIVLNPGERRKVYFTARPGLKPGEEIFPVFTLYSEFGELIDQITIGAVPIINALTGYIEDINYEEVKYAGGEYTVEVKLRHSWMGASTDYFITLDAPEFKVYESTKQVQIFPSTTLKVPFRVIPYGGGDLTLTASLDIGREPFDSVSFDVKVLGDKIYAIDTVEAPDTLEIGDDGLVFVTIKNEGISMKTLTVQMESSDFDIKTATTVLRLNPGEDTKVLFNIKAKNSARKNSYLTIGLYDQPENFRTQQYVKTDKIIDSKTVRIQVPIDDTAEEDIKKLIEEKQEEEIVIVDEEEETEVIIKPHDKEEETEVVDITPSESGINWDALFPYIVIVLLVIIAIILILGSERRKPKVEIYDIEPKKKAKKKSSKKKK